MFLHESDKTNATTKIISLSILKQFFRQVF